MTSLSLLLDLVWITIVGVAGRQIGLDSHLLQLVLKVLCSYAASDAVIVMTYS